MQTSSRFSWSRCILQALLLAEQLLGERLFQLFCGPIQRKAWRCLEQEFAGQPAPSLVQVDRRENLSPEEFFREYMRPGRPVIFSAAAADWECVRSWTLSSLGRSHGESEVLLVDTEGLTGRNLKTGFELLSLRELVEGIRAGNGKYLRFSPLLHKHPELRKGLNLSWFEGMRGRKTFAQTYYLFMGGKGQRTLLHNDQPCNLYVQVDGEKRWTLYDVRDSVLLYPKPANTAFVKSQVDLKNPDFSRFPLLRHARPLIAELRKGDILYVPPFTWHEVENLSETIAFGYRFSSLSRALGASICFSLLRLLSTNPPIWKSMSYGKDDTNLIWAHSGGFVREVLRQRKLRRVNAEAGQSRLEQREPDMDAR